MALGANNTIGRIFCAPSEEGKCREWRGFQRKGNFVGNSGHSLEDLKPLCHLRFPFEVVFFLLLLCQCHLFLDRFFLLI
jgi:hypothetical protein